MYLLAYNNAVLVIWPIFGSANQLLASLALIAVSVWLINRKKTAWFTILPAIFMMVTTIYSSDLFCFMINTCRRRTSLLSSVDILLIILAIGVIYIAFKKWMELRKNGSVAAV